MLRVTAARLAAELEDYFKQKYWWMGKVVKVTATAALLGEGHSNCCSIRSSWGTVPSLQKSSQKVWTRWHGQSSFPYYSWGADKFWSIRQYLYMHHLEVWSARVSYVSLHPGTPKDSKKRGIPNWAHFCNRFLWIWSKPLSTHHTSTSILRNFTTVHWEEPCYCRHNQVFKEVITSPAELLSKICTVLKLLLVVPATNAVSERLLVLFVELTL